MPKIITSQQELAENYVGMDHDGFMVNMSNAQDLNEMIKKENARKFNDEVEQYNQKFKNEIDSMTEHANSMAENLQGLEIMPVANYLIIEPFKNNPFRKLEVTDSGLILSDSFAPIYKSEEDGQYHEEEQMIGVATVIEAGPKCEFVRAGDVIMYPKPLGTPVPFYNLGFQHICENKIICVINEKLTERKNNI